MSFSKIVKKKFESPLLLLAIKTQPILAKKKKTLDNKKKCILRILTILGYEQVAKADCEYPLDRI